MSYFSENRHVLTSIYPKMEQDIFQKYRPSPDVQILPTSSGEPTARVKDLYLHSRHNPRKESKRIISQYNPEKLDVAVVGGFGLGYHIESLLSYDELHVLVVEPDVPLFLSALSSRDLTKILRSKKISFLLDTNVDTLRSLLAGYSTTAFEFIDITSIVRTNPDFFRKSEHVVKDVKKRKEVNKNTLKRFGKLWIRNSICNLPIQLRAHGLHTLFEKFTDIPAVLIGAGPSFDEVGTYVADLQKRFLIVAVDTAYKMCRKHEITPDIIVSVDPQYWNTRHLDNVQAHKSLLVSEPAAHSRIFRNYYKQIFLSNSIFPLGKYFDSFLENKGDLGAGGSVATSGWDLLRRMGNNPIFLVGVDLSFPHLKTHAQGGFFEKLMLSTSNRIKPYTTKHALYVFDGQPSYSKSNDGNEVMTDQRMIVYKYWFEDQQKAHPEVTTYTLSENGIAIEGISYVPVETLLKYPNRRKEIYQIMHSLTSHKHPKEIEERRSRLKQALSELNNHLLPLEELSKSGKTEIAKILNRTGENRLSREEIDYFNEIDKKILQNTRRDIVGFLMQPIIDSITKTKGTVTSDKEVMENMNAMYEGILQSVQYTRALLHYGQKILS